MMQHITKNESEHSDLVGVTRLIIAETGKPFVIEGVGTITKTRDAQYEFLPGNFFAEKIKDKAVKEHIDEVEEVLDFKSVFLKMLSM